MMRTILIAFVPVLHEGYKRLFEKYKDADLYIFGPEIIKDYESLSKDIRQLDAPTMKKAIAGLGILKSVHILDKENLKKLSKEKGTFVSPDEDVSQEIAKKYFKGKKISFEPIFLRWDKYRVMAEGEVRADQKITLEDFDRKVIKKLQAEGEKSSDMWRRIGAAIIKNKKIILTTHNKHQPSAHSPFAEGDPRDNFGRGIGIEYSTSLHAEAGLIAEAAKKGIKLEGASMYASTFPCPPCAKQIAYSGIKKLYYTGGYSVLDQERILKSQGVEIIFVKMN